MAEEMNEIWELYADDGAQALDATEEALEALQDGEGDPSAHIGALFRAVHTFKGNSRVLGLATVESRAHLTEDLIGLVRDEGAELTEEVLDVLVLAGDHLRNMLEETASTHKDVDPAASEDLMAQLRVVIAKAKGETPPEDAGSDDAAAAADDTPAEAETAATEDATDAEETTEEAAPAAAPVIPGLGGEAAAFLAGAFSDPDDVQMARDDDDDWFADDEDKDEDEAEEEADDAPSPADTADQYMTAEVVENAATRLLADATYLKIFTEMVDETVEFLSAIDGDVSDDAFAKADNLAFASERVELEEWVSKLQAFEAAKDGDRSAALARIIEELKYLKARDLLGQNPEPPAGFDAAPAPAAAETEEQPAAEAPAAAPASEAAAPAEEAAPASGGHASAIEKLRADKSYLKIYTDMVDETVAFLAAIDGAVPDTAYVKADGLAYASEQLGLEEWVETLKAFDGSKDGDRKAALDSLLEKLAELKSRDLLMEEPKPADVVSTEDEDAMAYAQIMEQFPEEEQRLKAAMTEIGKVFTKITDIATRLTKEEKVDPSELEALADGISDLTEPFGFVRAAEAGEKFRHARKIEIFRAVEMTFYEEMTSIERVLPEGLLGEEALRASQLLRSWCAEHIFETLQSLRSGLDSSGAGSTGAWFPEFEQLMRRGFHASNHYNMETAAQLTMALVDIFARVRTTGAAPDVILIQMARGFVDTMELVFDALYQGDTPDIARLEQLFEEAANVSFAASGVVTAKSIEEKLGLPKEFHRVLSPESVKTAQSAIDEGKRFFVLRSDLNHDDELAEKFLSWISSGQAKMITNVTVFAGENTLFDFLIATSFSEARLAEALAEMDPSAKFLQITLALKVVETADGAAGKAGGGDDQSDTNMVSMESLKVLEAIGEISAGQSMVASMLGDLANTDVIQEIFDDLRNAGLELHDTQIRAALRESLERHMAKLRNLNDAQAQLTSQLASLQEQSVAMRSRPADVLLRPLTTFVSTESRKFGGSARMSTAGGELILDQIVIEELRAVLKRVLSARVVSDPAPRKFHMVVDRDEDQVRVELTDDGGPIPTGSDIDQVEAELKQRRGTLRKVALPNGGVRIHIEAPLQMVVMEGMVVRIGSVHYVLPIDTIQRIHQGSDMVSVSASKGQKMLRLSEGELVPIRSLPGGDGAKTQEANDGDPIFVIVQSRKSVVAICVDELLGQQLVLLRPLKGVLAGVRNMSGVAILNGGEIGMVVAVSRLDTTEMASANP